MGLEIEKIIKIIIVVAVLVVVAISIALLWQNYIKPYLEELGKPETAGIKGGMAIILAFGNSKIKRYLNS